MRIKEVKVYKFNELSEESKNKVIENYIKFMMEVYDEDKASDNLKRAVNEAERMRTPWFCGEYIWEYCKDEILDDLNHDEDMEYEVDGTIA